MDGSNNNRKRAPADVIDLMASSDDDESDSDNEVEVVEAPPPKKKKPPPYAASSSASNTKTQKPPTYASSASSSSSNKKQKRDPLSKNTATANVSSSVASLQSLTTTKRAQQQQPGSERKFSVATYNIWFNQAANPEQRMRALAQALLESNSGHRPLLFVGFQEVTAALYSTLKPILESAGYRLFCQDEAIFGGHYGCALAVLARPATGGVGVKVIQHGFQPYRESSTCQGRGFLHVRAQLPNSTKQVLFTTTHLESYMPPGQGGGGGQAYTGSTQREQQVQELEKFCHHHMKRFPDLSLAMISGDLNWDDERVQSTGMDKQLTSILPKEWTDTWIGIRDKRRQAVMGKNGKVKKKDEPNCYTYDGKANPMLGGSSLRRRFDRILVRDQNGVNTKVEDIELIGQDQIGDTTWTKESQWNGRVTTKVVPLCPSDHFGYVVKLVADGV